MGVMTKSELEAMIKDIVNQALEPLKEVNRKYINDMFAAQNRTIETRPEEKGKKAARLIRAFIAGKGDPDRAAHFAKKSWGDEAIAKALAEGTPEAGGYIVPPEYSTEIIELLRARAVVRQMGPTILPMSTNTIQIPKLTGGATANYIGENTNIPKTEQTFGQLTLTAKKLSALVPISNDLIRDSSPQADAVVRDDLVAALALREDIAFLRDDGTNNKPKGVRYWAHTDNVIAANATVNLANVTTDLGKLILALRKANVRFIRPGWILGPTAENYLMTLRDANGNFAFKDEMLRGTLFGFPYRVSTQLPENLGAGANESEIYFVDWADAIIGENMDLIIDVSREAAYHDGTNVVSAFSLDQTVIKAITRHDFALRYDKSAAVLTGVTWSAAS